MIKIAIADDEQLFRLGLRYLLSTEFNFNVIIDCENGRDLLDQLNSGNIPDVILLDLKMPILNGIETLKILTKNFPKIPVIMLTSYDGKGFILNSMNYGSIGYLLKNVSPEKIIDSINRAMEGEILYDDDDIKDYLDF